jgi:hypothetical protein
MNKRQRSIIANFIFVTAGTAIFVGVMINVKDVVNKSEAIRAMELLGEGVRKYRDNYHSTPPESYFNQLKNSISTVRLGDVRYRAQWIGFDDGPDTVLAYSYKNYRFFVKRGYVVMRLDGSVEWIERGEFVKLLKKQQTETEVKLLNKQRKF